MSFGNLQILSSQGSDTVPTPNQYVDNSVPGQPINYLRDLPTIRDFGARQDGITDDTAAIQACIDAQHSLGAATLGGVAIIPPSPTATMFSNIVMRRYTSLISLAPQPGLVTLRRIPGATGNAIQDDHSDPLGATGVSLQGFTIDMNGTSGNGVDLGNGSAGWGTATGMRDIRVLGSGTANIGFRLNPGGVYLANLLAYNCAQGVVTTGQGNNVWLGIFCVQNSVNDIVLGSTAEIFVGTHLEPNCANSVLINIGGNKFYGINVFMQGNGTDLFQIASGFSGITIAGLAMALNGKTLTNLIHPLAAGEPVVAGTVTNLAEWHFGNNTTEGRFVDSTTGHQVQIGSDGGIAISEGSNCKQGTVVLNGTTEVTVPNTKVTSNSRIFLTIQTPGGTVGSPYISSRIAGTSFGVKSTTVGDTSTAAYTIFEPAS